MAALEHKARRPDVLVDEATIFAFYDDIIPDGIANGAAFEKWRRQAERENPQLLYLSRDYLMRHSASGITEERFPDSVIVDGCSGFAVYLSIRSRACTGRRYDYRAIAAAQQIGCRAIRLAGSWIDPRKGNVVSEGAPQADTPPRGARYRSLSRSFLNIRSRKRLRSSPALAPSQDRLPRRWPSLSSARTGITVSPDTGKTRSRLNTY